MENGEKSPFFIYFEHIKNTIHILHCIIITHIVFYLFALLPILKMRSKKRSCKNCNVAREKCGSLVNSIVIFARV